MSCIQFYTTMSCTIFTMSCMQFCSGPCTSLLERQMPAYKAINPSNCRLYHKNIYVHVIIIWLIGYIQAGYRHILTGDVLENNRRIAVRTSWHYCIDRFKEGILIGFILCQETPVSRKENVDVYQLGFPSQDLGRFQRKLKSRELK